MKIYIIIAKIIFALLSAGGGYFFIENFFQEVINHKEFRISISLIVLTFVEVGTIIFLHYFFKNLLKRKIDYALMFSIVAVSFLSISFLFTAYGSAKWAVTDTAINTQTLTSDYEQNSRISEHLFLSKQDSLTKLSAEFKSLIFSKMKEKKHWKKAGLQLQQQELQYLIDTEKAVINRIKENEISYSNKVQLNAEQKIKKLSANALKVKSKTKSYFLIAGVIMFFVLIFNFLPVYLARENKDVEKNRVPIRQPKGKELPRNKQLILDEIYKSVGFPPTKKEISLRFAGETGSGINRFANYLKEETKTDYSLSTVKNLINEFCNE